MNNISITARDGTSGIVTITSRHEHGTRMRMDANFLQVEQPGPSLVRLLRIIATAIAALGENFICGVIEARQGKESAWIDLHVEPEHQQKVMLELHKAASPLTDQSDHEELAALELWIADNQIKMGRLDPACIMSSAELSARLICLLEIMHTALDNPGDLEATIAQWRQRRERIRQRIGS